jgi:hypothetical protein
MPTVEKVNPILRNEARSFNGKTVQQYQVDFVADASGELEPGEAVEAVLRAFAERATVIMHSALTDGNTQMTVFVEGEFPTDTYDGENSESFGTYIQSEIVALGATYGPNDFDMTAVTVADGTVYLADDVVADYATSN